MKVLLLTGLYPNPMQPANGSFNASRVKALVNAGHQVQVIAPVGKGDSALGLLKLPFSGWRRRQERKQIPAEHETDGVRVYHPPWSWRPHRWFWGQEHEALNKWIAPLFMRVVEDFKPDVVLASWLHPFGTVADLLPDIPWFAISEGSDLLIYPDRYPGWDLVRDRLNRLVKQVILVSPHMEEVAVARGLQRTRVIMNGFETELFKPADHKPAEESSDKLRLLSIGNLTPVKGHDLLLDAMKELYQEADLTLVGDGGERGRYERFIHRYHLPVTLTGAVPHSQLAGMIQNSDLLVIPSRSESFGIVALEAQACGVPVVATRTGGLPYLIEDEFNGLLCDPESPESLTSTIRRAAQMSWNPRAISERVHSSFSWDRWREEFEQLINNVWSAER